MGCIKVLEEAFGQNEIIGLYLGLGAGLGSLLLKFTQVKSKSTSTKNTLSKSNKYFQKSYSSKK